MSDAPSTPCTAPHCRRLARPGENRCATHQRPTAHARGYKPGWAEYSRAWLSVYPWCGQRVGGAFSGEQSACARAGLRVKARVVDHIVSLSMGGDLFNPANHQSMCHACNAAKKVT